MPKITAVQREARRQEILGAALRCFSRDGFHNTTTADIVREAGVSQGVLYLYFANKDDIVVALGDDRHQAEAFLNTLAQKEQDPIHGLLTLIELYGKGLSSPTSLDQQRVGVQGWGEALRNPRIHASVVEGASIVHKAIARLVERGQRTGQVRASVEPMAVARIMVAIFQGLVLQVVWGQTPDLAACGEVVRGMVRDSLLTPEGRDCLPAAHPSEPS
jgi:AcrR family transcriptional regulator